ncbi:MAG: ribosome silencing factor [Candidatus Wallbacteria bacterium]|nr:ribosome silencing factor [Candidatus Wallbacteria bacterium]
MPTKIKSRAKAKPAARKPIHSKPKTRTKAKAAPARARSAPKSAPKQAAKPPRQHAPRPAALPDDEAFELPQTAPASPADYPEKVRFILGVLDDMKAIDVDVYWVNAKTILADYFVICSGSSSTHTSSLADAVYLKCKEHGWPLGRLEGDANPTWKILDYGDVVLHVFLPETRDFYKLEEIWGEGQKSRGAPVDGETVLEHLARSHPRAGSGATSALKRRRSAAKAASTRA